MGVSAFWLTLPGTFLGLFLHGHLPSFLGQHLEALGQGNSEKLMPSCSLAMAPHAASAALSASPAPATPGRDHTLAGGWHTLSHTSSMLQSPSLNSLSHIANEITCDFDFV